MGYLYSWVKSIVVFMVFITILSNLFAKSDFKKYMNLVTGLLLMMITISPILKLFHLDSAISYNFDSRVLSQDTKELETQMEQVSESQQEIILNNYKERIKDQIRDILSEHQLYLISAKFDLVKETGDTDFGKIKSMTVVASYLADEKERESLVEKVQIEDIDIFDDKKEKRQEREYLSAQEINIKNILTDFYNIEADNINISIQGGQEANEKK